MELPIQLKFFKKIELYQEYKYEDKKSSKTVLQSWNVEKEILKWAVMNHHHLGSVLENIGIKNEILHNKFDDECSHGITNLVERGYAENYGHGIKITKEGFLMGEVIYDVSNGNFFSRLKYQLLFVLVWVTAISGAFIVIFNAISKIIEIIFYTP